MTGTSIHGAPQAGTGEMGIDDEMPTVGPVWRPGGDPAGVEEGAWCCPHCGGAWLGHRAWLLIGRDVYPGSESPEVIDLEGGYLDIGPEARGYLVCRNPECAKILALPDVPASFS